MSSTAPSPFAGIKLSDQTALTNRGTDQQLFSRAAQRAPVPVSTPKPDQQPTHLHGKVGTQEPRKVGTQAYGKHGVPVSTTENSSTIEERPLFDIRDPATEKNSYMFSEDELWALRNVESELEQTYRIEISKYNIVRLGLHYLLEDYKRDKNQSFLVRRLGLKSK